MPATTASAASDRRGEPAATPAVVGPARVVGVAEEHRVVEVEDEPAGSAAENAELPARQELALQDHRVESRRARASWRSRRADAASEPLAGQRPARRSSAGANARIR